MLTGELSDRLVPAIVLLTQLFVGFCGASNFLSFQLFCLQEPPEDDANIIEKILASKTVQEVGGPCACSPVTSTGYIPSVKRYLAGEPGMVVTGLSES